MPHILIIPSEEFMPTYNRLDGIFQYHQATILQQAGYQVGVLSIKLSFSIPMVMKGLGLKAMGKKAGNDADNYAALPLLRLGASKLFSPRTFIQKEMMDNLRVYRIDGLHFRRPIHNQNHLSWVKAGMICFKEYVKDHGKPDVIHAHNAIYAGMLEERIKQTFKIPYIITEYSSTFALGQADHRILKRVKKCYTYADGLYAVSEAFAQLLNTLFSIKRFQYLPNVLDQYLENIPLSREEREGNKFIFLHIASLLPVKDQRTLLLAFAKVAECNEKVELWIGGGGELYEELVELSDQLTIRGKVKFLGVLDRPDVVNCIQQSDCFVLSSKYETFGVVTIEAMLFGKPVIVTRCGVGQDIVSDKIGFVVEVGNVNQMADAMSSMVQSHAFFDPNFIRSYTIQHFGKTSFLKKIQHVYKALN